MNSALPHAAIAPPSPCLRVSGLHVTIGHVQAIAGLDLDLAAGEIVALTGEPGSGKTTLVRALAGDIAPALGSVELDGQRVTAELAPSLGVTVVWQDLELCDNLDVAETLLLGQERRRLIFTPSRFHAAAAATLRRLDIPIPDTTMPVGLLSSGQRQMLAIAKAVSLDPRVLLLDEPTVSLGAVEGGQVERLIASLREAGTAVLLATRDLELIFRLADRIVVLRHGRVAAELDPRTTHPDDVAAVRAGQPVDTSARRQLTRLHGLTDRLVSADPSSSLSLIVSALASALGTDRACIHVATGEELVCAASLGFPEAEVAAFGRFSLGADDSPVGRAASSRETIVDGEPRLAWSGLGPGTLLAVACTWSAPVAGPGGVSGVITVFRASREPPLQDELDLLTLYAGYAAAAIERDRLLEQVTARNRVLETIREMLQALAGPVTLGEEGLSVSLGSLCHGLQADEVCLLTRLADDGERWRAYAGPAGTDPATMSESLHAAAASALDDGRRDGTARTVANGASGRVLVVPFDAPGGPTVLAAAWSDPAVSEEVTALIEDAAHSLNLALEREEAGLAHQEAAALRRSRELQRGFLSRLSHELRTPLTAIRGYASSLMAPDVTWDGDTQHRFLQTIAAESARLGRLVDDLLDFSMIESGVMRLQRDWCEMPLVLEAAVSCIPQEWRGAVSVGCDPLLPTVWADHDRLEQVFVNLLSNAFRHNPPGTSVRVCAADLLDGRVELTVADDGDGFPADLAGAPFESARRPRPQSAGAGLGLSIARGIIEAHGGTIRMQQGDPGTRFTIRLPIEAPGAATIEPAAGQRAYA